MVNWRELGEVPDSEDEDGFDSQAIESAAPAESAVETTTTASRKANEKDIWDIPSSQEEHARVLPPAPTSRSPSKSGSIATSPRPTLIQPEPTSSPLSTPGPSPDLPPVEELVAIRADERPFNDASPQTLSPLGTRPNDVSNSIVDITSPTLEFGTSQATTRTLSRPQPGPVQIPAQTQPFGHDTEQEEARLVAARYERSLRARRPEQMRPYFTERTRFNNEWREHGLRPLRFANEEDESRRRRENPNERGFDPLSQEDSQAQKATDESQPNQSAGVWDGPMITESPSPPKTSPSNHRGGPSSQMSSQVDTDDTNLDWDELPTLQELTRKPPRSLTKHTAKRKLSPPTGLGLQKRRRATDTLDSDPPPRPPRTTFLRPPGSPDPLQSHRDLFDVPQSPTPISPQNGKGHRQEHTHETTPIPQHPPTSSAAPAAFVVESSPPDDEVQPSQKPQGDDDGTETGNSSDSEADIVNRDSRRIRGVLPASWLRLDQQPGPNKIQKKMKHRQRNHSPEHEHRRGVAQRRQTAAAPAGDVFLFEDSEDEAPRVQQTTDDVFHNQTRLTLERDPDTTVEVLSSDDGVSVVEDDYIDLMRPGRKRQLKLSDSVQLASKRQRTSGTTKTPFKTPRQPKITGSFSVPKTVKSAPHKTPRKRTKNSRPKGQSEKGGNSRIENIRHRTKPPQLSILDVIESDAPQFLKIAARTAKSQRNQGRDSPGKKSIQLATRWDHIDAVSVLKDWRDGSIKQRPSVTAAKKTKQPQHRVQPLAERSSNAARQAAGTFMTARGPPRKLTRCVSDSGHVSYKPQGRSKSGSSGTRSYVAAGNRDTTHLARPGQLETDSNEMTAAAFHAKKKLLDRFYRANHGGLAAISSVASGPATDREPHPAVSFQQVPGRMSDDKAPGSLRLPARTRIRKQPQPQKLDIDAPQYSHANDPLPVTYPLGQESAPVERGVEGAKLLGLGPYGMAYTHHFEIFPLDPGVYFHESTLLGAGVMEKVMRKNYCEGLNEPRPRVSLTLGEQTLKWGSWNAQVSSEMGVVLDYAADQLQRGIAVVSPPTSPNAAEAANYLLSYAKDSMTFDGEADAKSFVARVLEVVQSFNNRVISLIHDGDLDQALDNILPVYDRLVLVVFLSLRICRNDPTMMSDQFQMEELLKSVAGTLVKTLSRIGLNHIRRLYGELSNLGFRERGLRGDAPAIHSWVLLLRLLENARIPRTSFWDVVQGVMVSPDVMSTVNANVHERLWEDMFTLLPLVEFNDTGVVIAGRRRHATTDGWGLPQKLLKRVFQLYRENQRQSPGFNSYCRALVGRCHYLVQQWGWRRSSSVIGVIFDFFGSQDLAHLRNEEFYKSPRFLESLAQGPTLAIEPEDRCFHIFLKLVALSLSKLKEDNSTKDIRNLVARTVPNHNRQYLKEQNIHERDLAALRNHHDLLCTLYWASPPEMRPSLDLIERLVVPASSHKEACLINLRAWNQLARFVVATGEATISFKPFNHWRNTFFQQMMHQFDSVASDIEQQFLGLSKDISKSISTDMITTTVSANKAAVMDVLYLSATASLDVMKHAHDLEAATFALSTVQLQRVFKHFSAVPPELDWAILRVSLSTLDAFLCRVDEFKENEESQQSESQILNSAQADDALLVLDHDLASSYFSMARTVLSSRSLRVSNAPVASDKPACIEQVVSLGARMGMRFINAGVMKLGDMFKFGKHGLFEDVPHKLGVDQRKYLTLFITKLLKHGFDGFHDASFTLCELWMLAIVKPREVLTFENQLAEQLHRHQVEFIPDALVGLATSPEYGTNRDMFEFAISWMRKSVRDAGPSLKKTLVSEHSRTLRLVMDQIKGDLKIVSQNVIAHTGYVNFVRDIISLIRAHGSDICTVDEYFYQINEEYSPSVQDPQLQVAGMMSYGLRLTEGDTRVVHQLFFFLFNNFKLAMMNDKTGEEVVTLGKGLRNPGILSFVLGTMLPAIVRASAVETSLFLLLDVYAQSWYYFLAGDVVPPELTESNNPELLASLRAMIDGMKEMNQGRQMSDEEVHLTAQFVGLVNLFWPSLYVMSLSGASSTHWDEVKSLLREFRSFATVAERYLGDLIEMGDGTAEASVLFGGLQRHEVGIAGANPHVASFTENIITDARRNWISSGDRITILAPGKARATQSTQSGQGVERPRLDMRELIQDLYDRTREWNEWWDKVFGTPKSAEYANLIVPVF